ncbi:MAG: hypothetical protein AAF823_04475 [Planctomycetota bacterium]
MPSTARPCRLLAAICLALVGLCVSAPAVADAERDARRAEARERIAAAEARIAEQPGDLAAELDLARAWYDLGVTDHRSAAKEAEKRFDELAKAHPDDAVIKAYLGSCRLLHAKREWAPWRKYELSKEGVTLMNEAVEADPENLEVRFVRAATTENLPERFEMAHVASEDYAFLAERLSEGQLLPNRPAGHSAFAMNRHALRMEWAHRPEDAIAAYRTATELAPDSRSAAEARESLERLGAITGAAAAE